MINNFWGIAFESATELLETEFGTEMPGEVSGVSEIVVNQIDMEQLDTIVESLNEIIVKLDSILSSFQPLNDALVSINNLIFRLNEYADFTTAVAVSVLFCIIYYVYLRYFTKF